MYTHITVVLDRTGSMESIRKDVIGGYNAFLDVQKAEPDTTITLIQFDSQEPHEVVYANRKVGDAQKLTPETYVPRAMTPLYDAVGHGIVELGQVLSAMPIESRPDKVIFVIITDGFENASVEYTAERVRAMLEHQRDVYKWEFVFLSADLNSFAQADAIGIPMASAMAFDANSGGVAAVFAATASNSLSYSRGTTSNMAWTGEQREEQEQEKVRSGFAYWDDTVRTYPAGKRKRNGR